MVYLFKHVDSFELTERRLIFKDVSFNHVDSFELRYNRPHSKLTVCDDIYSVVSASSEDTDTEEDSISANVFNPEEVGCTNHLSQRMWERGYTQEQLNRVIQFGCRCQELGGHWKFTYKRLLVITDSHVKVGITMYEKFDTNCVRCDAGKDLCICGFCRGCCENSSKSNPMCPGCRRRGIYLCSRGFCTDCCYGYICRCPGCGRKVVAKCDRGYCADCCWGCPKCR